MDHSIFSTPRSMLPSASALNRPVDKSSDWLSHPGHVSAMVAVWVLPLAVFLIVTVLPHRELDIMLSVTATIIAESEL